jgi:starvation-inducible DNA-binding protein
VKGSNFSGVHGLLGEVYDHLAAQADEMAERISQLGGRAIGTLKVVAGKSEMAEIGPSVTDSAAVVGNIAGKLADYSYGLLSDFRELSEIGDDGSANIMIGFHNQSDKDVWLLESHLM